MSRLWLSILEGPDPRTAVPIMASSDPALIRAVQLELARRLGANTDKDGRPDLQILPDPEPEAPA